MSNMENTRSSDETELEKERKKLLKALEGGDTELTGPLDQTVLGVPLAPGQTAVG